MADVYLAIGTNLGDRVGNLRRALAELQPAFSVAAVSPVYETEPKYVAAQPRFLNLACRTRTTLLPHDALRALKLLEAGLGREATSRFGPRVIDLDILFYDDIVLDTSDLSLPHPRLPERAFVLAPLAEIAPNLMHPVLKLTMAGLRDLLGEELNTVQRLGPLDDLTAMQRGNDL